MKPLNTYACYNIDEQIRMESSSGAVFSLLAEYAFAQNGIVYGVAMSEDCRTAEFIAAKDTNGLKRLRGSKYLQAKMGDTYKSIRNDLEQGALVLFSGTGCQVNGLKNFLGKEYDNLICVDVICHGVPSPALWREYVRYQEEKYGEKLQTVNFRCKTDGWETYGMRENQVYIPKRQDPFMQMFLRNYCLRPSCYDCVAKKIKMADITIADFWGIDKVAPEMNDRKGCSLVLIRTEKGKQLFERIRKKLKIREVSYEEGIKGNPAEYQSASKPKQQDLFFQDMKELSFEELKRKYAAPVRVSIAKKVIRKIKRKIKKILEKLGVHL